MSTVRSPITCTYELCNLQDFFLGGVGSPCTGRGYVRNVYGIFKELI